MPPAVPICADHCLTRSASAKRVKQRTVTAMFGSASAAAARRCRQMVQDRTSWREASTPPAAAGGAPDATQAAGGPQPPTPALRSTSAPPAMRRLDTLSGTMPPPLPHLQLEAPDSMVVLPEPPKLQRETSDGAAVWPESEAEAGFASPEALPASKAQPWRRQLQTPTAVADTPASPLRLPSAGEAANGAMQPMPQDVALMDQATQPLDAVLWQQHQRAAAAERAMAHQPAAATAAAVAEATAATSQPVDEGTAAESAVQSEAAIMPPAAQPLAAQRAAPMDAGAAAASAEPDADAGMCTPPRQVRQTTLPCASPLATIKSFSACVVGRRFQQDAECAPFCACACFAALVWNHC